MTRRLDDDDRFDDVHLDPADLRATRLDAFVRDGHVELDSVDSGIRALRLWADEQPMAWRQIVLLAGEGAPRLTRTEILDRAARNLTFSRRRLWIGEPDRMEYAILPDVEGEEVAGDPGESERIFATFEMDAEPIDIEAAIDAEPELEDIDAEVDGEWEAEEIDAATDGEWEAEEMDAGAAGEWEAEEMDAGAAGEWEAEEMDAGAAGEWTGAEEDEQEAQQAETLRQAAAHGTPFCAECERLKAQQAAQQPEQEEAA